MCTSRTQRRCRGSPARTIPSGSKPPSELQEQVNSEWRPEGVGKSARGQVYTYLGAAPVLVGEGEGGERADAPGAGEPHRLLQRAPPGLVPERRRHPPRACPPRVPVHHHRHVTRQRLRLQPTGEKRLRRRCGASARACQCRAAGGGGG